MTNLPVPIQLSAAAARLVESAYGLLEDESSPETVAAYRRDWDSWLAFCGAHGFPVLPGHPAAVVLFITDLVERGAKPATIERRLAGISFHHRQGGHDSPTRHRDVHRALKGMRRRLGVAQRKSAALGRVEMRRLVASLDPETMAGIRDRALLLVGWFGGMRRSEIVGLDVADLEERSDGMVAHIRKSKTDQEAAGRQVFLPWQADESVCPVRALLAWTAQLEAQGFTRGPIFRGLGRTGVRILVGRLTGKSVERIVGRAVAAAGLAGGPWTPHSLRAGFCTQSAENGSTALEIAVQTGHVAGGRVLEGYIRRGDPARGNAVTRLSI